MTTIFTHHPSSYRDPSGFVFEKDGILYRQVNISFKEHFDHFIESGLYSTLVQKGLLISHDQIHENLTGESNCYITLKPDKIPFISYPYEWSFDMLKDAALLTLTLVREALGCGMLLIFSTQYNIQWNQGKLVFIDTLSFEKYEETPWIAYRQFCESFLGPLLIMHYSKMALPQLLLGWPEGIPLPVIQSLLPGRSRFSFHTYLHIHLHAKISAGKKNVPASEKFSKQKLLNLISSLEILINKLKLTPQQTAWSDYYDEASQRKDYLEQKKKIIDNWIKELPGIKTAADLGANEGEFSKLLASKNIEIIAADFDSYCINKLYNEIKKKGDKNIQPLVLDISNPSPSIGVNNEERMSFIQRTKVDMVLALAVIHHLAIGKNIPFSLIAEMFGSLSKYLIIEFIPKEDPKVKAIFLYKKDIYKDYNEQEFIRKFESIFIVSLKQKITGTNRTLFLMMRK